MVSRQLADSDDVLDRLESYYAIAKFLLASALHPDTRDEDELVKSIAAAYPCESVAMIARSAGRRETT